MSTTLGAAGRAAKERLARGDAFKPEADQGHAMKVREKRYKNLKAFTFQPNLKQVRDKAYQAMLQELEALPDSGGRTRLQWKVEQFMFSEVNRLDLEDVQRQVAQASPVTCAGKTHLDLHDSHCQKPSEM